MAADLNTLRIAEVYRLHLGGLSQDEIVEHLVREMREALPTPGARDLRELAYERVVSDLDLIQRWQEEYQDPEKVRTSIVLDLDALFKGILVEIRETPARQANAKALFYREAREALLQKALLYGLNTQNVNVNQKTKMWTILQELRADATQLESEANHLALAGQDNLPIAITAPTGLLVESDPGDGR